jgi:hypothetical protein
MRQDYLNVGSSVAPSRVTSIDPVRASWDFCRCLPSASQQQCHRLFGTITSTSASCPARARSRGSGERRRPGGARTYRRTHQNRDAFCRAANTCPVRKVPGTAPFFHCGASCARQYPGSSVLLYIWSATDKHGTPVLCAARVTNCLRTHVRSQLLWSYNGCISVISFDFMSMENLVILKWLYICDCFASRQHKKKQPKKVSFKRLSARNNVNIWKTLCESSLSHGWNRKKIPI